MTMEERYQRLEDTVRAYNPTANFDKIRAAYEFAAAAHQGQLRKDGSPFVTHPLAVAQIVAEELHLDSESIEAALLHDTIEDTSATHEDIAKQFSPTVADLVEGVSKLTRVHYTSKAQEQMENLRKMLLAMSKDIRVILIKVSDRLHNMRTMEYQTPEKQKQKSFETMEIYAPIAHRLGMQKMKWELEDLSLKYLDPVGYREITEALDEKAAEYDGFMSAVHDRIVTRLKEEGIDATVYGRMKHPYSIYRKMYTQNKSLDDVFDLFAFRVIVDTVADCYNVLGIVHDMYKPIPGKFKDYISMALTPMVITARMVKKDHPNARIVFIGPCAAKKLEANRRTVRSDVDFVLTFEELAGIIEAKDIDTSLLEVDEDEALHAASAAGRGFAQSGGVAKAVADKIKEWRPDMEVKIASAQGLADCKKLLMLAKAGKYNGYLLEGMACPGGCIAGAGTVQPPEKSRRALEKYKAAVSISNPMDSQ